MFLGNNGVSNSLLYKPCGIDLDRNNNILYITDNYNHRVMAYAVGASSGTEVAGGNGDGFNNNQLSLPFGIIFDSITNSLIISNTDSHMVVRWPIGATSWTLLAGSSNGTTGDTSLLLNGPRGIAQDPMGNLYVADMLNHRIQLFMAGQTTGKTIVGVTGVSGNNATLLNRPYSIAFDSNLNLYVTDANNHRIQKFLRY